MQKGCEEEKNERSAKKARSINRGGLYLEQNRGNAHSVALIEPDILGDSDGNGFGHFGAIISYFVITNQTMDDFTSLSQSTGRLSFDYEFLPKSPVSPRVKNIKEDMDALHLSRQDNPYIMHQLERLSMTESGCSGISAMEFSPCPSPARSVQPPQYFLDGSQTLSTHTHDNFLNPNHILSSSSSPVRNHSISMEIDELLNDETDLHSHLIRSPPPQFPQKLSVFVFPNSNANSTHSSPFRDRKTPSNMDTSSSSTNVYQHPHKSPMITSDQGGRRSSNDSQSGKSRSFLWFSPRFNSDRKHLKQQQSSSPPPPSSSSSANSGRRGSDSSILHGTHFLKPNCYETAMAASSSSLLTMATLMLPRKKSHDNSNSCDQTQSNAAADTPSIHLGQNQHIWSCGSREALLSLSE